MWFNKNRSCIEIKVTTKLIVFISTFNKNRSCIEIRKNLEYFLRYMGLIKTEVVLK